MAKYMVEIPAESSRVIANALVEDMRVSIWDGTYEQPAGESLWVLYSDVTWAQVATKKWQDLGMWGNLLKETEL